MKAIVYDRPGEFELREVPDPVPGPLDVVIRVLTAGVCGTDLHLHDGEFGPSYPLIPGHEVTGEIVATGAAVTALGVGQRVVIDNTMPCGWCVECRRARPAFCLNNVAQGVNAPGGFAELFLASSTKCFVVDDLPSDVAVFAEPTACVVHGLDVLAMRPESDVLLFGAGPTGILLAQLLAVSGAGRLTVAAPTQAKLDLIAERGADETIRLDRDHPEDARALLKELAPDGFDTVIDATGSVGVLEQTIPLTRIGGTVFVYGMTAESAVWGVPPYEIFRRELTVKGSFAQQYSFDRSVAALRNGTVDTSGMITHRFGLDDYAGALASVASSDCIKAVIEPNQ
jgi:D-arabinitol dehydrogenase (NADP+)